jgi:hypothetical protein
VQPWKEGDEVLAVRNNNKQGNRFHAVVTKVRKGSRKVTNKPLGFFNKCCGFICNKLACGALDRDYYYSYDVRFDDGIEEEHVPALHVFASSDSPRSEMVLRDQEFLASISRPSNEPAIEESHDSAAEEPSNQHTTDT